MTRRALTVLAAVAALAVLVPVASAFFFDAVDQPVALTAATPDRFVVVAPGSDVATADPLAIALGSDPEHRAIEAVLTLRATDQLPGGDPVAIAVETAGGLQAVLRSPEGAAIDRLVEPDESASGHLGRIDLDVTELTAGPHTGQVVLRLTFGDGSTMRYVVPVTWTVE